MYPNPSQLLSDFIHCVKLVRGEACRDNSNFFFFFFSYIHSVVPIEALILNLINATYSTWLIMRTGRKHELMPFFFSTNVYLCFTFFSLSILAFVYYFSFRFIYCMPSAYQFRYVDGTKSVFHFHMNL